MRAIVPTFAATRADAYRRSGAWRRETVWQAFDATARRVPDRIAIVDGVARPSFSTVQRMATQLAAGLARLGIQPGEAVTVQLPNWHETVVTYLALTRLGAVVNPALPVFGARELRFLLEQSEARLVIVPATHRGTDHRAIAATAVRGLADPPRIVTVRGGGADDLRWETLLADEAVAPPPAVDAEAIALLLYTSGTTADPKGVLHSHATLLAEARSLGPVHEITADDVTLIPSPLAHIAGIVHAVLVPAVFGARAVLMDRWEPTRALALMRDEGVTYMVGAPTFLRDLADPAHGAPALPRFRLFSCGGADVDPALVTDAATRLGCVAKRVYGSSEFPTITTTGPGDPPDRRIDSDGRAIGETEMRVVDDSGVPVPTGTEGEVLARGPECFLGYRDASLNADTFTPDGWLRTGDLGILDASGFLRITGRKKDIIIRKGENISAREVEELLATHPAVLEVAVVGVPSAIAGEIACAVIRVRPPDTPPTLADLTEHLLARGLSKRKLPERLVVVEDFPRTASGKVLKRALKATLPAT